MCFYLYLGNISNYQPAVLGSRTQAGTKKDSGLLCSIPVSLARHEGTRILLGQVQLRR